MSEYKGVSRFSPEWSAKKTEVERMQQNGTLEEHVRTLIERNDLDELQEVLQFLRMRESAPDKKTSTDTQRRLIMEHLDMLPSSHVDEFMSVKVLDILRLIDEANGSVSDERLFAELSKVVPFAVEEKIDGHSLVALADIFVSNISHGHGWAYTYLPTVLERLEAYIDDMPEEDHEDRERKAFYDRVHSFLEMQFSRMNSKTGDEIELDDSIPSADVHIPIPAEQFGPSPDTQNIQEISVKIRQLQKDISAYVSLANTCTDASAVVKELQKLRLQGEKKIIIARSARRPIALADEPPFSSLERIQVLRLFFQAALSQVERGEEVALLSGVTSDDIRNTYLPGLDAFNAMYDLDSKFVTPKKST